MDISSIITGTASGGILAIVYLTYKLFKHSSCRSSCCGVKSFLEVDLTTPSNSPSEKDKPFIQV